MRTDVEQLVRELPEAGIARATRLGLVLNPGLETEAWRGLVTCQHHSETHLLPTI